MRLFSRVAIKEVKDVQYMVVPGDVVELDGNKIVPIADDQFVYFALNKVRIL